MRRVDFGEADRLLTVYTPHLGKLRLLAKGIRRPVSKMAGHLELFTHSRVLIAKGRNLDLVTQSETIDAFLPLREDLLRTTYAHYVAELLDRLTPEHLEDYPLFSQAAGDPAASGGEPSAGGAAVRFHEMESAGPPRLPSAVEPVRPVPAGAGARTQSLFRAPGRGLVPGLLQRRRRRAAFAGHHAEGAAPAAERQLRVGPAAAPGRGAAAGGWRGCCGRRCSRCWSARSTPRRSCSGCAPKSGRAAPARVCALRPPAWALCGRLGSCQRGHSPGGPDGA